MTKLSLLILSFICLSTPSFAYQYSVMGLGNSSCGTWTQDMAEGPSSAEAIADGSWVLGFISGFEDMFGESYKTNLRMTTDYDGVLGWIDNYCSANPTVDIVGAAQEFLIESKTLVREN